MNGEIYKFPPACGVYHLVKNGAVQYVGQSRNVLGRVSSWALRHEFDSYRVFECSPDELNDLERQHIKQFDPPLNKAGRGELPYIGVSRALRHDGRVFDSADAYLSEQPPRISSGVLRRAGLGPNSSALMALAATGKIPMPVCRKGAQLYWDREAVRAWLRLRAPMEPRAA